jgi:hypothetical protein
MFRGSVKGTGYPLHLPVFPSLSLPCVTVYHHISTGLYPSFSRNKATHLIWISLWVSKPKHGWEIYRHWGGLFCAGVLVVAVVRPPRACFAGCRFDPAWDAVVPGTESRVADLQIGKWCLHSQLPGSAGKMSLILIWWSEGSPLEYV